MSANVHLDLGEGQCSISAIETTIVMVSSP
jgi:hypothetical protein